MDYLLEASPPHTGNTFSHVANQAACTLSARLHFATEIVLSVAQLHLSFSMHLGAADHCTTPALQGFCVYHQLDSSGYSNFALEELLCLFFAKRFAKVPSQCSLSCPAPQGAVCWRTQLAHHHLRAQRRNSVDGLNWKKQFQATRAATVPVLKGGVNTVRSLLRSIHSSFQLERHCAYSKEFSSVLLTCFTLTDQTPEASSCSDNERHCSVPSYQVFTSFESQEARSYDLALMCLR